MEKELKSKCCNAKIEFCGGGYDGEEIVPVYQYCANCLENCGIKNDSKLVEELPF